MVTESRSLSDLFEPLARSGQGYLFPVLCFLVREVWTSPRALQLLHLLLPGIAVFVFARWAPLGRRERALFVLGYFLFYEYAARGPGTRPAKGGEVVLVLTWEPPPWKELDAAGSRLGAIVATEDYRLYRLRHERLAATEQAAGCR